MKRTGANPAAERPDGASFAPAFALTTSGAEPADHRVKHIATRLGMSQASSGMIAGVFLPFFGAFLAWRGLSAGQIGLLLSAALMLRAAAGPASGIVADAHNDRRSVMLFLYWIVFLGFGALAFTTSPILIFLVAIPAYVAYGAATPLLESVCARLSERYGFEYGRVRIWASTAFVLTNVAGGICAREFGIIVVAPMLAAAGALCIVSTLLLPAPPARDPGSPLMPRLKATLSETRELLGSSVFLVFLLAVSCVQASHGFYYGYGGLHWRLLGYSESLIGIIWPVGVLAEIVIFSQAARILRVLGPSKLILLGGIICVVRWTILAFDPALPLVVFAQFLHGGTFALAHLGAVYFILRAVPPRLAATAQSLYFVCAAGVMMGLATFVSGSLYGTIGGRAYLIMSVLGAIAMVLAAHLARRWHGGRIIHGVQQERADTI
jgi:MFS transporter, PPP family, 3-phenylpropionic acid transporter